jgi:membrane protein
MIKFFGTRIDKSKLVQLFLQTFIKWQRDDCVQMGAALAFYALFSLFPLLMILLSVSALFVGPDTNSYNQIVSFFERSFPSEASQIVEETLVNLNQNSVKAGIIGSLLLLLTASSVFGAISRSLDKIWQVERPEYEKGNWLSLVLSFLISKFSSFGLVMGTVILLMASQLLDIAMRILFTILEQFNNVNPIDIDIDKVLLWQGLQLGSSYFLLALVLLVLFKIVPSTRIAWNDVWLGALLTASLFISLQQLVNKGIIQIGSRFQSYGVIGSVMILLFWLYLACQLFLLGSAFTYIYAHKFGSRRG